MRTDEAREHMHIKDVARELAISVQQAHKLVTGGGLPAIDISTGGKRAHWRIERAKFDKWLADREAQATQRFSGAAS